VTQVKKERDDGERDDLPKLTNLLQNKGLGYIVGGSNLQQVRMFNFTLKNAPTYHDPTTRVSNCPMKLILPQILNIYIYIYIYIYII
jgi:hypothetical protein